MDAGHTVVGIDNLNDYYDVRLKRHRLAGLEQARFTFQQIDLEDEAALSRLFADHPFSVVINLAARAGVRYSVQNPQVYFRTNVMGNLYLLEQCRRRAVEKYVLASTSSLYAGQPMPFQESLPVNEPVSPYAASKKGAEVTAYTYHALHGMDVSVLRFFTVYGPAGRPDMAIFRFASSISQGLPIRLYGDGNQRRDFTYVEDIVRGVVAATRPLGFEIINLGGGQNPVSMWEIITRLETLIGEKACVEQYPADAADVRETWADISKAAKLLDWKPLVDLDQGLAAVVSWFRQNRDLAKSIALGT